LRTLLAVRTVLAFINDEALSREAAIAFCTVTSIGPVLLIVIAIAGLAFGQDAAQNALTAQLSGLMGQQTADVLQAAVASAASKSSGIVATMIGKLVTAISPQLVETEATKQRGPSHSGQILPAWRCPPSPLKRRRRQAPVERFRAEPQCMQTGHIAPEN
jgi:hypothetical protein